jgi:hypothetical protein
VIGALFLAGEFKEFADCAPCLAEPGMPENNGCEEPTDYEIAVVNGEALYRCPATFVDAETSRVTAMWLMLENHSKFPVAGGVLDQSATFMDAVGIIDDTINRYNREQAKKPNG